MAHQRDRVVNAQAVRGQLILSWVGDGHRGEENSVFMHLPIVYQSMDTVSQSQFRKPEDLAQLPWAGMSRHQGLAANQGTHVSKQDTV